MIPAGPKRGGGRMLLANLGSFIFLFFTVSVEHASHTHAWVCVRV